MMRGRIRNDEEFGRAAGAAIERNTDYLAQLILTHVDHLLAQADAYTTATVAARLPAGGAQTGAGGTAPWPR